VAAVAALVPIAWDSTVALVVGAGVIAAGVGAVFVAASAATLSHVDPAEAGVASGVLSTFYELGAAFGVAAASSLAAGSIAGPAGGGFAAAFAGAVVVAAAAAVAARMVVPGPSAAAP
jgi:hypothetical protein